MTAWIQHVKNYQQEHGCSYKEAMSRAKDTYQKQTGGSLKSMVRKATKTAKRARKVATTTVATTTTATTTRTTGPSPSADHIHR